LLRGALFVVGLAAAACGERVVNAVVARADAAADAPPDVFEAGPDLPPPPPVDAAVREPDAALDLAPPPPPDVPPALPRSCAEILALDPAARDGRHTIAPEGTPLEVYCDMTGKGGGWTRIIEEDFSSPPAGFTRNVITTCGAFGSILGGHRQFGNETVAVTVSLRAIPHRELRVKFEFVVLDSWDNEAAFADLDARRVWSVRCDEGFPATCQQTSDQCGWDGMARNDGKLPVDITAAHLREQATLSVGAVLDQNTIDESWGLDNLSIWVR
jgi:hypothetical protein